MSAGAEAAWAHVAREAARLRETTLIDLFARDAIRADALTFSAPHLTLDLSRQRIDAGALQALEAYSAARGVFRERDRMFAGEAVNNTEGRAAMHWALRAGDAPTEVRETRDRMRAFAAGLSGIDAVVSIGIGGSDLGPRLVYDALKALHRADIRARFASNVDNADIDDALEGLDPARTLVIVCSKTFTTLETLANAEIARAWLGSHATGRLVAVSAAPERAKAWGASEVFPFWDWVGGRYSLWSAIGLVLEIALQPGSFDRLLTGAAAMDAHFRDAPFAQNAPMLAAAVQAWNREALGRGGYALVPYAERLRLLPAYLQQLEMESNGKRVDRDGRVLARPAAGVTWGAAGTNAQHSFFQLLHQGVEEVPVEFIVVKDAGGAGRTALLANALAQAQALMHGARDDAAPHRAFPGNRASTMMALDDLSPESLGALLAFYEHRTAAQAWLAGVNPFDQWGVELGKAMARDLTAALEGNATPDDPATSAWVERLRT
ncbi:MAG: glucose-6-phosphate isomerase [Hyphomonadaceae bacterium]